MKVILTVFCILLLSTDASFGQSISYPKIDKNNVDGLDIMDIAWLGSTTVVHFLYCDTVRRANSGHKYIFLAPPHSKDAMFIKSGSHTYKLLKTEGIPNKPKQMTVEYRKIYEFYAFFERIPYENKLIDIIEGETGGWNLYGIHLPNSGGESYENNHYSTVPLTKERGVYLIPCSVNGLPLKFIFDTGASNVSLSITEAVFMLKNGFLKKEDIGDKAYYQTASGDIVVGTKVILKELEVGGKTIHNIEASVTNSANAPLLLGQSALNKIGRFEFDYANNLIKIFSRQEERGEVVTEAGATVNKCKFETSFDSPSFEPPLRESPDINSRAVYNCPMNAKVCVLNTEDNVFYKVIVNGYTDYVSKGFLKTR